MKHSLTIKPAIAPTVRHEIEDLLQNFGYNVTGGGTMTDRSECDISFEGSDPTKPQKQKNSASNPSF